MTTVYIPAQWRDLTGDVAQAELDAATVREVIPALEARFPGISERAIDPDGLAAGLAVSVDGAIASRGLASPVAGAQEIHFLPAIGGG